MHGGGGGFVTEVCAVEEMDGSAWLGYVRGEERGGGSGRFRGGWVGARLGGMG